MYKMYRSASWNRVSDEYSTMQSSMSPSPSKGMMRMDDGDQQLPLYDQNMIAEMAKKERARVKFAENAVHLIPLVLILCALILWLFSSTPGEGIKGESMAVRIEGLSIEGKLITTAMALKLALFPPLI